MAEMGPAGAAPDRDEVIALILGTGTGGAPCRRGGDGLIDFPDALADLGHHQVDPRNTEPCNCGSVGCVELSTSGTGVVRNFNRRSRDAEAYAGSALQAARGRAPGSIGAEDIAWAAARGDPFTLEPPSRSSIFPGSPPEKHLHVPSRHNGRPGGGIRAGRRPPASDLRRAKPWSGSAFRSSGDRSFRLRAVTAAPREDPGGRHQPCGRAAVPVPGRERVLSARGAAPRDRRAPTPGRSSP